MSRDPSVGAVCGRTHPMGTGPMVWYQVFDYAIGHWLLKVAEHVMGSVLCSPGCFSVYRCRAIQDILPQYASSVECALDFLTKDMGKFSMSLHYPTTRHHKFYEGILFSIIKHFFFFFFFLVQSKTLFFAHNTKKIL